MEKSISTLTNARVIPRKFKLRTLFIFSTKSPREMVQILKNKTRLKIIVFHFTYLMHDLNDLTIWTFPERDIELSEKILC